MKSKGMSSTSRRTRTNLSENSYGIAAASAFGACIGALLVAILLLVCTFICISSENPDKLTASLAVISVIIVYFSAGFAAVRKRRAAIPCGALSGGILSAVFFIISLFLSKELSSGLSLPVSLLIRLSFIAVSILGALLGTNVGIKRKRRK